MAAVLHNRALMLMLASTGAALKMALYNGGTLNPDHNFMADLNGTEVSAAGYVPGFAGSGRKLISSVAYSQDDTNNLGKLACGPVLFPAVGEPSGTAMTKAVVYVPGTSDANSVVVGQYDAAITLYGANLTIQINASGLAVLQG